MISIGCLAGYWSMTSMQVDAIPDLGETQVIVYSHWDRSPDLVEAQVTYPIVTALLGASARQECAGILGLWYSMSTSSLMTTPISIGHAPAQWNFFPLCENKLPEGVKTEMGPDATSLGWVFQYALVDTTGKHNLMELRFLSGLVPPLLSEAVKEWPERRTNRRVQRPVSSQPLIRLAFAATASGSVRLLMLCVALIRKLRAVCWSLAARSTWCAAEDTQRPLDDFKNSVVTHSQSGTPIRVVTLEKLSSALMFVAGVADLDGKGDVVSGIVIMRNGENALQ